MSPRGNHWLTVNKSKAFFFLFDLIVKGSLPTLSWYLGCCLEGKQKLQKIILKLQKIEKFRRDKKRKKYYPDRWEWLLQVAQRRRWLQRWNEDNFSFVEEFKLLWPCRIPSWYHQRISPLSDERFKHPILQKKDITIIWQFLATDLYWAKQALNARYI